MSDLIERQAAIDAFDLRDDAFLIVAIIKSKLNGLPSAQPEKAQLSQEDATFDCISRQAAIDALDPLFESLAIEKIKALPSAQSEFPFEIQDILDYLDTTLHPIISPEHWNVYSELHDMISTLSPAQPDITDEQAIEHLQLTGWMQNHDRVLTQSTWDIIRCKDCKYGDTFHEFDEPDMPMKCLGQHYGGTYPDDFCSYAERRTE